MKRVGWVIGLDVAMTALTAAVAAIMVAAWEQTDLAAEIDALIAATIIGLPTKLALFF